MSGPLKTIAQETVSGKPRVFSAEPSRPPDRCSICKDTGSAPWGEADYGPCRCDAGMRRMGVPMRFRAARLENFARFDGLITPLREWSAERGERGWYIHGPVGAGKSHLAAALCRHCAAGYKQVRFMEISQYLALVRQSYGDKEALAEVRWAQERVRQADVAVLDDLGGEAVTGWTAEQMTMLVNTVYEREAALVVTSNVSPGDLRERLDARAVSRIVEMTKTLCLNLPDRRARG